jgi:hypothetical protein
MRLNTAIRLRLMQNRAESLLLIIESKIPMLEDTVCLPPTSVSTIRGRKLEWAHGLSGLIHQCLRVEQQRHHKSMTSILFL